MNKQNDDFAMLVVADSMSRFKDILKPKVDLLGMVVRQLSKIDKKEKRSKARRR